MQLARFLNKVFKKGGFVLTDANSKDYIIGEPDYNPIKLKILITMKKIDEAKMEAESMKKLREEIKNDK